MTRDVACIGYGMTIFRRRMLETGKEMCWQAARMALDDAGLTLDDIDMVIFGSAPDAFDGIHMKGQNMVDGMGATRKPMARVYVGGGTGVFTAIAAWWHVASGMAERVLVVNEEKMSSCLPHAQSVFAHIWDPILDRPIRPNLVWIFAMEMQRYMSRYKIPHEDIAAVAVKNKRNAVAHPCAQLADAKITVDDVLNSEPMALPVRRLDISPPSDGAAALVFCADDVVRQHTDDPVFISGVGWNLDTTMWQSRDLVFPQYVARAAKMAYKMAGITHPRKQIQVAEPYDPFDYKECHHMEGLGLSPKGQAAREVAEGLHDRTSDLPTCPSGGLLGVGNPIAATLGIKVGELYLQLAGKAGKRQVKNDPNEGVTQAWGDLMQVGTVLTMRRG
jgi:acetyl-CoA C-acetyltransferase